MCARENKERKGVHCLAIAQHADEQIKGTSVSSCQTATLKNKTLVNTKEGTLHECSIGIGLKVLLKLQEQQ